jgi:uncharacterized protein (TIGR03086 family)
MSVDTRTDPAGLFHAANDLFDANVHAVRADQWHLPTPCTDWDVRTLVNHVTVEDLWAPSLLAGRTIAEVGDAFAGDQLGGDPVATWERAAAAAKQAAARPGAATSTVHLSYGDDSAGSYLMQMFADHLIHGWDLAAAIGADRTLPEHLVAACADWFTGVEPVMRAATMIADRPPVPEGAGPQTRLLAAFGRRADWARPAR